MQQRTQAADPVGAEAVRRVAWRLLPFLALCYLVAYIDRVKRASPRCRPGF